MAVRFITKDGRTKMIDELVIDADTFEQLDRDIREATKPVRMKLGIKEEQLNEGLEKRMAELTAGLDLE
jgi:hypothetical protein